MGVEKVNGTVNLFDLNGENIYVGINDALLRRIEKNIDSLRIGREYFKSGFLSRLQRYKRISLTSLKRTSFLLDIDSGFIEKNITMITSHRSTHVGIKNPRLPFDFRSKEGMILIASIFGDGGISKEGNVRYHNQDRKLIDLFIESLNMFGNVDFKIYHRRDNTYHVSLPIILGHIFHEIGVPWGYKTMTNPVIPGYIFNLDKEMKSSFIRQFFNDEGNVRLKDRRLQVKQTIELKDTTKEDIKRSPGHYSPSCLKGLKELLLDLNIISKISMAGYRKEESIKTDWELSIYGKESLHGYYKLVGFDSDRKRRYLKKCISSYKFPSAGRNERLFFALQYLALIDKEGHELTKHTLSEKSKRSLKTATYFLVDMKRKGFVEIYEKRRDSNGRLKPLRYKITKKGWDYLKGNKSRVFIEEVRKSL